MENNVLFTTKRLVMLGISSGFLTCSHMCRAFQRLIGKKTPGICVVVYYHGVLADERESFARQMDTLARFSTAIPADQRTPLDWGRRYAVVTFDDGFDSVFEVALPELRKRNIPATVFVIPGALGRTMGWEGYPEKVMSLERLKLLPTNLITIGSHTMTHPSLPTISEQEVKAELTNSRTILEEALQRRVTLFSFPFGEFTEEMIEWCRKAGYERIFTTLPDLAFRDPYETVVGRVRVDPTDWPLEFRLKVLGAYKWIPFVLAWKRRLFRRHWTAQPSSHESASTLD